MDNRHKRIAITVIITVVFAAVVIAIGVLINVYSNRETSEVQEEVTSPEPDVVPNWDSPVVSESDTEEKEEKVDTEIHFIDDKVSVTFSEKDFVDSNNIEDSLSDIEILNSQKVRTDFNEGFLVIPNSEIRILAADGCYVAQLLSSEIIIYDGVLISLITTITLKVTFLVMRKLYLVVV
jgi:hypothetical protein